MRFRDFGNERGDDRGEDSDGDTVDEPERDKHAEVDRASLPSRSDERPDRRKDEEGSATDSVTDERRRHASDECAEDKSCEDGTEDRLGFREFRQGLVKIG